MNLDELVAAAKDAATVKRVFGEPYEKDGVTVIPAATIAGGAGGGSGRAEGGDEGAGGGFGVNARPAGAYVIHGDNVEWRPAVDVNRLVATLGAVAVAFAITRARIQRARAKARRS